MGSNEKQSNFTEDSELLQGQLEITKHIFAFMDSLVLKSAIDLRIADILNSHNQPMSLTQIASKIESKTLNFSSLERIMRLLVRKKIFTVDSNQSSDEDDPLYDLTPTSKWLIQDNNPFSVAPGLRTFTHPLILDAWQQIGPSIKEGGTPFVKAHGENFWEMAGKNEEFNGVFNSGMAAFTSGTLEGIVRGFKEGFSKLEGSLVDIGGGIGRLIAKIVEAHPHINGINFDLPHAVENAPQYPGVTHVGGDMFEMIPSADNVIIKSVLLDWADEECIKILKNCQKAVSEKKGKVIIVDIVLYPDRHSLVDDIAMYIDLMMMTHYGGKNRTESDWKILLNKAGFTHFNIITIPCLQSVIEAFP